MAAFESQSRRRPAAFDAVLIVCFAVLAVFSAYVAFRAWHAGDSFGGANCLAACLLLVAAILWKRSSTRPNPVFRDIATSVAFLLLGISYRIHEKSMTFVGLALLSGGGLIALMSVLSLWQRQQLRSNNCAQPEEER
jgi:peptidoglycan/LPS O-acetylase OafA/YrhL